MSTEVQTAAAQEFYNAVSKMNDYMFSLIGDSIKDIIFGSREYYDPKVNANDIEKSLIEELGDKGGAKTLEEIIGADKGKEYKTDSFDYSANPEDIILFAETAKAHGVDYTLMQGEYGNVDPNNPAQVTILFRASDTEKMEQVFAICAEKIMEREAEKAARTPQNKANTPPQAEGVKFPTKEQRNAVINEMRNEQPSDNDDKERKFNKGAR